LVILLLLILFNRKRLFGYIKTDILSNNNYTEKLTPDIRHIKAVQPNINQQDTIKNNINDTPPVNAVQKRLLAYKRINFWDSTGIPAKHHPNTDHFTMLDDDDTIKRLAGVKNIQK